MGKGTTRDVLAHWIANGCQGRLPPYRPPGPVWGAARPGGHKPKRGTESEVCTPYCKRFPWCVWCNPDHIPHHEPAPECHRPRWLRTQVAPSNRVRGQHPQLAGCGFGAALVSRYDGAISKARWNPHTAARAASLADNGLIFDLPGEAMAKFMISFGRHGVPTVEDLEDDPPNYYSQFFSRRGIKPALDDLIPPNSGRRYRSRPIRGVRFGEEAEKRLWVSEWYLWRRKGSPLLIPDSYAPYIEVFSLSEGPMEDEETAEWLSGEDETVEFHRDEPFSTHRHEGWGHGDLYGLPREHRGNGYAKLRASSPALGALLLEAAGRYENAAEATEDENTRDKLRAKARAARSEAGKAGAYPVRMELTDRILFGPRELPRTERIEYMEAERYTCTPVRMETPVPVTPPRSYLDRVPTAILEDVVSWTWEERSVFVWIAAYGWRRDAMRRFVNDAEVVWRRLYKRLTRAHGRRAWTSLQRHGGTS